MKNLIYIIFAMLILAACDDSDPTNPTPEPEVCPAPVKIPGIGYHTPPAHKRQSVSFDYQFLAFKNNVNILKVLNLQTGLLDNYILDDYLPVNVKLLEIEYLDWSPYDNHRILIQAKTRTDTSGTDTKYVEGCNLYIFDIKTKVITRVSPSKWNQEGATGNFYRTEWLPQSKPIRNLISISSYVYILEDDKHINTDYGRESYTSNNGLYTVFFQQTDQGEEIQNSYGISEIIGESFVDKNHYGFEYFGSIRATKISWSRDNKYIAISTRATDDREPSASQRYFEIMVVDFEKLFDHVKNNSRTFLEPEYTINLRKEFCKYAFADPYIFSATVLDAEFISDTTMAVSMHEDGAEYSYLYEISIHGEMIRQLTFEP